MFYKRTMKNWFNKNRKDCKRAEAKDAAYSQADTLKPTGLAKYYLWMIMIMFQKYHILIL